MKNTISFSTRVTLIAAAAALLLVLFTPVWRIELDAPQYPEGLSLSIHANGLKGDVDIINGLNHYIGMKTLHSDDFIEFTILPWLIPSFSLLFVAVALLNRRKWLYIILGMFVAFGIGAMYDFWRWEYDYGHHLDPNAAIIVPGMAYQPPLIGFKQLLNFGAYSIPDTGGWIFIAVGIALLICTINEWRRVRKDKLRQVVTMALAFTVVTPLLNGCNPKPEAILTGRDNCNYCKMGIADVKYAAELVTEKGRIYKFDDIHCLLAFSASNNSNQGTKGIYVCDFSGQHELIDIKEAFLLKGDAIKTPMNGHIIAFKQQDSMTTATKLYNAEAVNWQQLIK